VKFVADRSFADPDAAARELVEIANAAEGGARRPYCDRADQRTVSQGGRLAGRCYFACSIFNASEIDCRASAAL
jgi:hypothetical protein